MKKKILSVLLVIFMFIAIIPAKTESAHRENIIVKEIAAELEYDYIQPFSEGLACVEITGYRSGFIDQTGEIVIPLEYSMAFSFGEGLAAVRNDDGQYGYINKSGAIIVPFDYNDAWDFNEGSAVVQKDDKWAILQVISYTKNINVTFGATRYTLNGEPFEQQAMVYNGVAYLPAAYLAEKLGLTAKWDAETNITTLTLTSIN